MPKMAIKVTKGQISDATISKNTCHVDYYLCGKFHSFMKKYTMLSILGATPSDCTLKCPYFIVYNVLNRLVIMVQACAHMNNVTFSRRTKVVAHHSNLCNSSAHCFPWLVQPLSLHRIIYKACQKIGNYCASVRETGYACSHYLKGMVPTG